MGPKKRILGTMEPKGPWGGEGAFSALGPTKRTKGSFGPMGPRGAPGARSYATKSYSIRDIYLVVWESVKLIIWSIWTASGTWIKYTYRNWRPSESQTYIYHFVTKHQISVELRGGSAEKR